jgi:hypothetical protein
MDVIADLAIGSSGIRFITNLRASRGLRCASVGRRISGATMGWGAGESHRSGHPRRCGKLSAVVAISTDPPVGLQPADSLAHPYSRRHVWVLLVVPYGPLRAPEALRKGLGRRDHTEGARPTTGEVRWRPPGGRLSTTTRAWQGGSFQLCNGRPQATRVDTLRPQAELHACSQRPRVHSTIGEHSE